ncbi:MAG: AlpA family phage regulatory protein [Pseudoxanthomonas mexicana]|nr:AlpA family phage regulatory protein [Pseudoxanthomonas mexicana]
MSPNSALPKGAEGVADAVAPAFYRMADLVRITGLSRATLYRRIDEGRFPPPVHLGGRACGWRASALQAWIDDPEGYAVLCSESLERRL